MHSAEQLRDRYLQGTSSPGEINAIARVYATQRSMPFQQALEEVHDGLGYELFAEAEAWNEVSRSLVPLGRRWINGL